MGGRSIGVMFANIAPGNRYFPETHNTLNFASKSREVPSRFISLYILRLNHILSRIDNYFLYFKMHFLKIVNDPMVHAEEKPVVVKVASRSLNGIGSARRGSSEVAGNNYY